MAHIRKKAPRKSIFFSLSMTFIFSSDGRFGGLKKRRTAVKARPPNGKLICHDMFKIEQTNARKIIPRSTIAKTPCL